MEIKLAHGGFTAASEGMHAGQQVAVLFLKELFAAAEVAPAVPSQDKVKPGKGGIIALRMPVVSGVRKTAFI